MDPSLKSDINHHYRCISCQKTLNPPFLYEYYKCPYCKSFIYISDKDAAEENRTYFNEHFTALHKLEVKKRKRKIFAKFLKQDMNARKRSYLQFYQSQAYMNSLLSIGLSVLEIGFGEGHRLLNMLEHGIEAYGMDISEVAVDEFRRKHPQYKDCVFYNEPIHQQFDIIYSCALFEHLNHPREFLKNTYQSLNDGGKLILDGVPVLNPKKSKLIPLKDINFWKPCHQIIYSIGGMSDLLKNSGFQMTQLGTIDDYNYRVLSMHLEKGFNKVSDLRNPCLNHPELPSIRQFHAICKKALSIDSLAVYCTAVFEKVIPYSVQFAV
jgi:cyclopropane fatty-acyl-phospholipid synthase-like methyltransferase/DNA-directed RNA polymerase subunit RPC12/RpoP